MTIEDEVLIAYLDNELSAEERARVNAALAAEPQLQARLARHERVRAMLSEAFDPALEQDVPERLIAAAATTPMSMRWRLRHWLSRTPSDLPPTFAPRFALVAATLVIGIAVGWLFAPRSVGVFGDGQRLVAQAELGRALDHQLAADEVGEGPRVGVSFRAGDGRVCRTFDLGASKDNFAGIACRAVEGWTIVTLTAVAPPAAAPYELADAGMPAVVRGELTAMIAGEPFDAAQERRARDAGWR